MGSTSVAPLSPTKDSKLNFATPPTNTNNLEDLLQNYEIRKVNMEGNSTEGIDDVNSSPFMSKTVDNKTESQSSQSDTPPSTVTKSRPMSRIISGSELSPLKILQDRPTNNEKPTSNLDQVQTATPTVRSPLKVFSPIKRFPVKIASPKPGRISSPDVDETPRAPRTVKHERSMSVEDVIVHNEGLKHAIEIFEDEVSVLENGANEAKDGGTVTSGLTGMNQLYTGESGGNGHLEAHDEGFEDDSMAGIDDTMVSTFSSFSAVPNLTMFSKLAQSPSKLSPGKEFSSAAAVTPTPPRTYSPTRGPPRNGPLPNRNAHYESSDATTNLLEFTEQLRFEARSQSPQRKHKSSATVAATPQRKSLVNLLDFDIPPLPTPRSIPTITARELESLKSTFLSEISSLKATLSGKEAEVMSLKTAVGDAEKRVGESMEQLREERSLREQVTDEKEVWERRGREMETVLRGVKEEIVHSQRDKEELEHKLGEMDMRREAAEMMAQEAESKMAGMRAGKEAAASSPAGTRSPGGSGNSSKDLEIAVERVARELHAQYKAKHETKVTALKKSYEARWEKKVRELEGQNAMLVEENDKLRLGRDATMTRVVPADAEAEKERQAQAVRDSAKIRELTAEVVKLEAVVSTVKEDNVELRGLLEAERVEKGQLVTLAEEMMSMQSFIGPSSSAGANVGGGSSAPTPRAEKRQTMPAATPSSRAESPKSIARPSGLRAPVSRIGRPGHQSKPSTGGLPRPGLPTPARSGIMSSIEKMGNYRGRE